MRLRVRRNFPRWPMAGLIAMAAAQAVAQSQPAPPLALRIPALRIGSGVDLSVTATDNAGLSASSKQSDLILSVIPYVSVSSSSGPVQGWLNYSLTGLLYLRDSARNRVQHQNALSARSTTELLDNRLYLDADASISQQLVSAFGTPSLDPRLDSGNLTEVRTLRLSPRLQGQLGSAASYRASVAHSITDADGGRGESSATSAQLGLSGGTAFARLGWGLDAVHEETDFDAGRDSRSDRASGMLRYAFSSDLSAGVTAGRERSDVVNGVEQSITTRGWQADWRPSPRTAVSASSERRVFGTSHNLTATWRSPRTAWTYSDSRSISRGFGQPVLGSLGNVFDLLYLQLASQYPDPVERQQRVLEFMRANNIPLNSQLVAAFLTNSLSVNRSQRLSVAWTGLRQTLTLAASRGNGRSLQDVQGLGDDFATSSRIRQHGFTVDLAHRLTPSSVLGFTVTGQRSRADDGGLSSSARGFSTRWSESLGTRTTVSLQGRHNRYASGGQSFNESAIVATFSMQF